MKEEWLSICVPQKWVCFITAAQNKQIRTTFEDLRSGYGTHFPPNAGFCHFGSFQQHL